MAGLQALPASAIQLPSQISALLPDRSPELETEALLESVDAYIVTLSRKMAYRLSFIKSPLIDLVIDEVIQEVRIKLWWALQKGEITHLHAYIRTLIRREFVDLCHQQGLAPSLYRNYTWGEVELTPIAIGEEMQAPTNEFKQPKVGVDIISEIIHTVCQLPAQQRYAILCSLKDYIGDAPHLIEAFKERNIDIREITWPDEEQERRRIRASLSSARKRVRLLVGGPHATESSAM